MNNSIFKALNLLPGSPSFVDFHDALNLPDDWSLNQLSIIPAYSASKFNTVYPYYPIFVEYEKNK
jgi:hypothetical protein